MGAGPLVASVSLAASIERRAGSTDLACAGQNGARSGAPGWDLPVPAVDDLEGVAPSRPLALAQLAAAAELSAL